MFHHDDRDYNEAASAAAAKGKVKMEEIIHNGQASAESVVAIIQNSQPRDLIAPANRLALVHDEDDAFNLAVYGKDGYSVDETPGIHPHAFGQLMGDNGCDLGTDFVKRVRRNSQGKSWGEELIAKTVNAILSHRDRQRNLIRIDPESHKVKGFLSDKFRRMDARPLADSFMGMCLELGLVPIEGVASETKCRIRAVKPMVFEPIDNEPMLFGLEFGTSDFGDGGVVINLWNMRVWCTNTAVVQRGLKQVHLGGRLPDDLQLSDETYRRDALTVASAMRDVGANMIGPAPINRMLEAVRGASHKQLTSSDGIDALLKGLDKNEAVSVKMLYDGPDVVNLPPGETVYRLSNAVSFFAQTRGVDADKRLKLQEIAGNMIAPRCDVVKVREV